jgi:hypothetical protein
MKEILISFETAKLAKEKGFESGSANHYEKDGQIQFTRGVYSNGFIEDNDILFEAPTQSLLQKWLRDKHDIDVQSKFNNSLFRSLYKNGHNKESLNYHWFITTNINSDDLFFEEFSGNETSLTYEESLENGLTEALKLIN